MSHGSGRPQDPVEQVAISMVGQDDRSYWLNARREADGVWQWHGDADDTTWGLIPKDPTYWVDARQRTKVGHALTALGTTGRWIARDSKAKDDRLHAMCERPTWCGFMINDLDENAEVLCSVVELEQASLAGSGKTCAVGCAEGYVPSGGGGARLFGCHDTGEWRAVRGSDFAPSVANKDFLKCVVPQCPSAPQLIPTDASTVRPLACVSRDVGAVCTLECELGYQQVSPSAAFICELDQSAGIASWKGTVKCAPMQCPSTPPDVQGSEPYAESFEWAQGCNMMTGAVCQGQCRPGFEHIPGSTATPYSCTAAGAGGMLVWTTLDQDYQVLCRPVACTAVISGLDPIEVVLKYGRGSRKARQTVDDCDFCQSPFKQIPVPARPVFLKDPCCSSEVDEVTRCSEIACPDIFYNTCAQYVEFNADCQGPSWVKPFWSNAPEGTETPTGTPTEGPSAAPTENLLNADSTNSTASPTHGQTGGPSSSPSASPTYDCNGTAFGTEICENGGHAVYSEDHELCKCNCSPVPYRHNVQSFADPRAGWDRCQYTAEQAKCIRDSLSFVGAASKCGGHVHNYCSDRNNRPDVCATYYDRAMKENIESVEQTIFAESMIPVFIVELLPPKEFVNELDTDIRFDLWNCLDKECGTDYLLDAKDECMKRSHEDTKSWCEFGEHGTACFFNPEKPSGARCQRRLTIATGQPTLPPSGSPTDHPLPSPTRFPTISPTDAPTVSINPADGCNGLNDSAVCISISSDNLADRCNLTTGLIRKFCPGACYNAGVTEACTRYRLQRCAGVAQADEVGCGSFPFYPWACDSPGDYIGRIVDPGEAATIESWVGLDSATQAFCPAMCGVCDTTNPTVSPTMDPETISPSLFPTADPSVSPTSEPTLPNRVCPDGTRDDVDCDPFFLGGNDACANNQIKSKCRARCGVCSDTTTATPVTNVQTTETAPPTYSPQNCPVYRDLPGDLNDRAMCVTKALCENPIVLKHGLCPTMCGECPETADRDQTSSQPAPATSAARAGCADLPVCDEYRTGSRSASGNGMCNIAKLMSGFPGAAREPFLDACPILCDSCVTTTTPVPTTEPPTVDPTTPPTAAPSTAPTDADPPNCFGKPDPSECDEVDVTECESSLVIGTSAFIQKRCPGLCGACHFTDRVFSFGDRVLASCEVGLGATVEYICGASGQLQPVSGPHLSCDFTTTPTTTTPVGGVPSKLLDGTYELVESYVHSNPLSGTYTSQAILGIFADVVNDVLMSFSKESYSDFTTQNFLDSCADVCSDHASTVGAKARCNSIQVIEFLTAWECFYFSGATGRSIMTVPDGLIASYSYTATFRAGSVCTSNFDRMHSDLKLRSSKLTAELGYPLTRAEATPEMCEFLCLQEPSCYAYQIDRFNGGCDLFIASNGVRKNRFDDEFANNDAAQKQSELGWQVFSRVCV